MIYKDRAKELQYKRTYYGNLMQQRRLSQLCIRCGKPARDGRTQCQVCSEHETQRVNEYRRAYKKRAVEYLGGKCADCDFQTEYTAVYDFHHANSDEKESAIARMIDKKATWAKVQKELDKCILLCANCHRIRHVIEDKGAP